jgi:hypothetical protein
MAATIRVKGEIIDNPNDNNIGSAECVHCTATGGAQSVIVKGLDGGAVGSIYLHAVGDTIIIEKGKTDTITLADGKASSVITCYGNSNP